MRDNRKHNVHEVISINSQFMCRNHNLMCILSFSAIIVNMIVYSQFLSDNRKHDIHSRFCGNNHKFEAIIINTMCILNSGAAIIT